MRIQPSYNQSFICPYSFQAQEHDDEVKGDGNSVNYKYRMHDPRLGRFFAIDPLVKEYLELTPYQFSSNSPIFMIELEGMEGKIYLYKVWYDDNGKHVTKLGPTTVDGLKSDLNKRIYMPYGQPNAKPIHVDYMDSQGHATGMFDLNNKPTVAELNEIFGDQRPVKHEKSFGQIFNELAPSWAKDGAMEGGDSGIVPFEQGMKILGGTVAVILTGGTIAVAGEITWFSALSLACGADDMTTQNDNSTILSTTTGIKPEHLDKIKLGISLTNFSKGTAEMITSFSKSGGKGWTDKEVFDMIGNINDEMDVMKSVTEKTEQE
jgi:RHS repeat-associated protein